MEFILGFIFGASGVCLIWALTLSPSTNRDETFADGAPEEDYYQWP